MPSVGLRAGPRRAGAVCGPGDAGPGVARGAGGIETGAGGGSVNVELGGGVRVGPEGEVLLVSDGSRCEWPGERVARGI